MINHPNAGVAVVSAGLASLVVWLGGRYGYDISAETGAAVAGGAAALVLYIGRRGVGGTLKAIWRGSGK